MWLRTWLPWALGAAAAGATLAQKVCPVPRVVVASTVALAVLSIASSALAVWNGRVASLGKVNDDILSALHGALVRIVHELQVPFDDLGLNVYLVRPRLRWALPPLRKEQVRLVRLRLEDNVAPSGILWTKNKGVIGALWKNHSRSICWKVPEALNCTEEEWGKLASGDRLGLTYEELQFSTRYAGIIASPIVSWRSAQVDKYLGCLTLDCRNPENFKKMQTSFEKVDKILMQAAKTAKVAVFERK